MSILELFCDVDDFCQWVSSWEDAKLYGLTGKRGPAPRLSMSEVMTILIHFHQSHYRNFKAYYIQHVREQLSPWAGQLYAFCGVDSIRAASHVPLSARALWPGDRGRIR